MELRVGVQSGWPLLHLHSDVYAEPVFSWRRVGKRKNGLYMTHGHCGVRTGVLG